MDNVALSRKNTCWSNLFTQTILADNATPDPVNKEFEFEKLNPCKSFSFLKQQYLGRDNIYEGAGSEENHTPYAI